eukprot:TRINITY_DN26856_c0_g1_i1.p1 TRINITY_DN26856_c0_g1~~TRINITY_DN26856_c0_g1_i1.p1  ORF type:complete len:318 (-),score=58.04 TRINITY_DN26856_c0_g1_i1:197-1150(-)
MTASLGGGDVFLWPAAAVERVAALSGDRCTCLLLSARWRSAALREIRSSRFHSETPLDTIIDAVSRRPNLRNLDLAGCRALDGDASLARLAAATLAGGPKKGIGPPRAVHLAGAPRGFGRQSRQTMNRWGALSWVIPAGAIERGCALVSRPGLAHVPAQPHFLRALLLVLHHSATGGAAALVLNQPTTTKLKHLRELAGKPWSSEFADCDVFFGGDVGAELCLVHGHKELGGDELTPGVFVTKREEDFNRAQSGTKYGRYARNSFRWISGETRWGQGELEHELRQGHWIAAHCDCCHLLPGSKDMADAWHDIQVLAR